MSQTHTGTRIQIVSKYCARDCSLVADPGAFERGPLKEVPNVGSRGKCNVMFSLSFLFSQPSIYIDGWLYGMSMTSVTRLCL